MQSGEKVRIAYDKKCKQLRNQDVKGDDPSAVDKTRAAIRDLHTQIKVSIHSIEAISKRIETLRDEELQPQLVELIQGYVTQFLTLFLYTPQQTLSYPEECHNVKVICIILYSNTSAE